MDPLDFFTGFGKSLYPVAEPLVDDQIDRAADKAAAALVGEVKDTTTKWDDEGAEKLARFLKRTGEQIEAGLASPTPQPE